MVEKTKNALWRSFFFFILFFFCTALDGYLAGYDPFYEVLIVSFIGSTCGFIFLFVVGSD